MRNVLLVGTLAALLAGGCGDDPADATTDCSSASLSYQAAAGDFGAKYCTSCHDSAKVDPAARGLAPADVNFDSEAGWLEHGAHALEQIKGGRMPPLGEKPTAAEVDRLEQWLSCEGVSDHADGEHTHE